MHSRLLALLVVCTAAVYGREWSSSDGKKTFEATFVAVQGEKLVLDSGGGKNAAFPLAAFSAADREFAKNAQYITEAATKLGPQALEFSHRVEDGSGWICRLALPIDPKATTRLYTGETIFLVTADSSAHRQGERMEGRMLYGAGGRTYHPLQGDAAMVRAFALSAEEATRVWSEVMAASGGDTAKQAPNVIEPDVQIITRIGFGVVIGKNGLTAIDPELAKDAKTLVIHHDGKDHVATPFFPKDKAGADIKTPDIMLLTSAVPVEPARIGTKKTPEVGMPIFALSYELK
ncbi:MAG: hypothetical protein IPK32_07870 [Verrucomicrobiaceae bacterium]|nr:hypothetical protein [Verrucomicrobiaceae bacterium]